MLHRELRYERHVPGPKLRPFVEHYWLVANDVGLEPRREILIPNGRPMILARLGQPGVRMLVGTGERSPNGNLVAGVQTEPVIIEQAGESIYLAAQLTPFGLSAFFERDRLVNRTLSFEAWLGVDAHSKLTADLRQARLGEPAIRVFERCLEGRITPIQPGTRTLLERAIAAIDNLEALVTVAALAETLGISYGRLHRLFRSHIGVTPKQFIAIARYYRLVGELLNGSEGLSHLAALQGYYDQSHATRDFKRFTGISQIAFRERLNGIAQLMHQAGR